MPTCGRGIAISLALFALVACGKSTDEMPRPVYIWEGLDGSCGFRLAMDGDGTLWKSRECSLTAPKYQRVRALDETEASAVRFAFEVAGHLAMRSTDPVVSPVPSSSQYT